MEDGGDSIRMVSYVDIPLVLVFLQWSSLSSESNTDQHQLVLLQKI